jgi:hypothetical protein
MSFTNIALICSKIFSNLFGLSFMQKQAQAKTEEKVIIAKKLSFPNSVTMFAGTILTNMPVRRLSEMETWANVEALVDLNCLFTSTKRNFVTVAAMEHKSEPSVDWDMYPSEPELQPV